MINLQDITTIAKEAIAVLALLGITIEVVPIKVNPISWLLKILGNKLNKDLVDKVDDLSTNFVKHEIDQLRWNILNFSNSCMHGERHTKEEFDHIIDDHNRYEKIIKEKGLTNGQVDMAYDTIKDIYKKCLRENDFL